MLATADRFPDALTGAALAGSTAPILLTSGLGDLDPRVESEIARVTGDDCRYSGTGREHTAALIGATVVAENPGTTVLLARGDEFADAITGGAFAASAGIPVLLTPSTSLNAQTKGFIDNNAVDRVVVLGGTAAVDDATLA